MQKILLLLAISLTVNGQYQNYPCRVQYTGQIGQCQRFSSCPAAQALLRYYPPTLCLNDNYNNPVVCCPTTTNAGGGGNPGGPQRIQQGRISDRKCSQFRGGGTGGIAQKSASPGTIHTTIVGGDLTRPGEFSHMAAIGWVDSTGQVEYNCGGVLIDYSFVLTAAHCANTRNGAPSVVRVGGGNLAVNDPRQPNIAIAGISIHPNYSPRSSYNDIAILRLSSSVRGHTPACLWGSQNLNSYATAIGYGHTEFAGRKSNDLLKATISIYANNVCGQYYRPGSGKLQNGIVASQICAGDPQNNKDTCQGDSGGPILVNGNVNGVSAPYIVGITSVGQGCASGIPGIYTRVSSYIDWIESVIWGRG